MSFLTLRPQNDEGPTAFGARVGNSSRLMFEGTQHRSGCATVAELLHMCKDQHGDEQPSINSPSVLCGGLRDGAAGRPQGVFV